MSASASKGDQFPFNVRVYGILITEEEKVLLSDESVGSFRFTKFPGGGLEYGEGLIDALKREYMEECDFDVEVIEHIYTTDFFEKSSFNNSQILSVYYAVRPTKKITLNDNHLLFQNEIQEVSDCIRKTLKFLAIPLSEMTDEHLTFKTDKVAWNTFLKNKSKYYKL